MVLLQLDAAVPLHLVVQAVVVKRYLLPWLHTKPGTVNIQGLDGYFILFRLRIDMVMKRKHISPAG